MAWCKKKQNNNIATKVITKKERSSVKVQSFNLGYNDATKKRKGLDCEPVIDDHSLELKGWGKESDPLLSIYLASGVEGFPARVCWSRKESHNRKMEATLLFFFPQQHRGTVPVPWQFSE